MNIMGQVDMNVTWVFIFLVHAMRDARVSTTYVLITKTMGPILNVHFPSL